MRCRSESRRWAFVLLQQKDMSAVGFEPTRSKTSRPERNPLDHSGKLTNEHLQIHYPLQIHTSQHTLVVAFQSSVLLSNQHTHTDPHGHPLTSRRPLTTRLQLPSRSKPDILQHCFGLLLRPTAFSCHTDDSFILVVMDSRLLSGRTEEPHTALIVRAQA